MSDSGFLPDVNVWIALAFPAHAHHAQAAEAFVRATPERPACFCRATQQGFLRVACTPAFQRSCNIVGLTNRDALDVLNDFMASPTIAYRDEPAGLVPLWHRLAAVPSTSPKVWMDAYLAAFAAAGALQMVTLDQAFTQFAVLGITILTPTGRTPTE